MQKSFEFKVSEEDKAKRIDVFLAGRISDISRNRVKSLIISGGVKVDGKASKPGFRVKGGELVSVTIPEIDENVLPEPEKIELEIVHEDGGIIVVNKSSGMVVHPGAGNKTGTMVNALLYLYPEIREVGSETRPGIVHRLDKGTSGLMVVARTGLAYLRLIEQFRKKKFRKIYWAIVNGKPEFDYGRIDTYIGRSSNDRKKMAVTMSGGKRAISEYKVKKVFDNHALLEINIETGRTHQIRVHMAEIGHPIVGDKTYSHRKDLFPVKYPMLHSHAIGFHHPVTGRYMEFSVRPPEEFEEIVKHFEKGVSGLERQDT